MTGLLSNSPTALGHRPALRAPRPAAPPAARPLAPAMASIARAHPSMALVFDRMTSASHVTSLQSSSSIASASASMTSVIDAWTLASQLTYFQRYARYPVDPPSPNYRRINHRPALDPGGEGGWVIAPRPGRRIASSGSSATSTSPARQRSPPARGASAPDAASPGWPPRSRSAGHR